MRKWHAVYIATSWSCEGGIQLQLTGLQNATVSSAVASAQAEPHATVNSRMHEQMHGGSCILLLLLGLCLLLLALPLLPGLALLLLELGVLLH